jgi:hypothetical protein
MRKRCLALSPKKAASSSDAKVDLTCTTSKGIILPANRAFPTVPDEAHMIAAVITAR